MKVPAPFIGETYNNTFIPAANQRCVNWFPKGNALISAPGHRTWLELPTKPIRGWRHHKNKLIVVAASTVYEVNEGGAATSVGTIDSSSGVVHMASSGWDGNEVLMVDGNEGFIWNGSNVQLVSAGSFPSNPHHCLFDNGYFLVVKGDSGEFYKATNAYDAVNWDGSFATAEQSPDKVLSALVNRNDLWFLGERSLEVWLYTGEAFPWSPNRSAFQDYGIVAPETLTKFDNNIAWLAESEQISRVAVKTQGYSVQRISTTVIENEWAGYEKVSDATAFAFKMPGMGHFLVFQFPSAHATWVYDAEEGMWHEWEQHSAVAALRRHQGSHYIHFSGRHLIADNYNGKIYEMRSDVFNHNGAPYIRRRMGPNLISSRNNLVFSYLELIMHTGVGSAGDVDPMVRLSYSEDRGYTWMNWREQSLGSVGERSKRIGFNNLGMSKERIFQVEVASDANAVLTDSRLEIEEGGT